MPRTLPLILLIALAAPACHAAAGTAAVQGEQQARQAEVARRGAEVMPFDLPATVHVFSPSDEGGLQQVKLRPGQSAEQLPLIRRHLQEIRARFLRGDWSAPARIHGQGMPGLAELEAAPEGAIAIDYAELADGAELRYHSADPRLVHALHRWFAAQLADHGHDAMPGHHHHHDAAMAPDPDLHDVPINPDAHPSGH